MYSIEKKLDSKEILSQVIKSTMDLKPKVLGAHSLPFEPDSVLALTDSEVDSALQGVALVLGPNLYSSRASATTSMSSPSRCSSYSP